MTQKEFDLKECGDREEIIEYLMERDGYTYEELDAYVYKNELADLI